MTRRRNGGLMAAAALALAACATSSSSSQPGPASEGVLRTSSPAGFDMEMRLNRTDATLVDTLAAGPDRSWAELPAVFKALGLPVNAADARQHRLATIDFKAYRIEGQPLSRYLDCGRGITAGDYADSYQVQLSVDTQLLAAAGDPARSTIHTTVSADARPRAEAGNPVACQSKGVLEHRVRDLLAQRLASPTGG